MKELKDLTKGIDLQTTPHHYITYGTFDSRRFNLKLHERVANTPSEKEILADIPYRQGVIDVSHILGHRIYEQREITYTFYRFGVNRGDARDFQTTIENLLMINFDEPLEDSYEPDFFYTGKCASVMVHDDYERKRLKIDITFDLYPFKIDKHLESSDLFDSFNFDLDAFQDGLRFTVEKKEDEADDVHELMLFNASLKTHQPTIWVNASGAVVDINGRRETLRVVDGEADDDAPAPTGIIYPRLHVLPGLNRVRIFTSGVAVEGFDVAFDWRKERI